MKSETEEQMAAILAAYPQGTDIESIPNEVISEYFRLEREHEKFLSVHMRDNKWEHIK